jgi:NADH-quinone oxidoreductase subunit G
VGVLNGFSASARRNNMVDESFVAARAEGYQELEAALKGVRVPKQVTEAAESLLGAENLVIFVGGEGVTLAQHADLMQAAANLLILTGHVGRPNNGLIPVWPGANMQGALDMGFTPEATEARIVAQPEMWVIAEADPVAEDGRMAALLAEAQFVVVATQFMTPTAELADIVLPVQSFAEREGTFTNGMRRVQRFYMAQSPLEGTLPGWKVFAHVSARMRGGPKPRIAPSLVMRDITQHVLRYAEMSYPRLAQVEQQFPLVGGEDLYYGGTAYSNRGGLGLQWATNAEKGQYKLRLRPVDTSRPKRDGLVAVPIRLLYDREPLFIPSTLMHRRIPEPYVQLNDEDAQKLGIAEGEQVVLKADGVELVARARVDGKAPAGVVLVPRRLAPTPVPKALAACAVQKREG